jgi:hypothetical protein
VKRNFEVARDLLAWKIPVTQNLHRLALSATLRTLSDKQNMEIIMCVLVRTELTFVDRITDFYDQLLSALGVRT